MGASKTEPPKAETPATAPAPLAKLASPPAESRRDGEAGTRDGGTAAGGATSAPSTSSAAGLPGAPGVPPPPGATSGAPAAAARPDASAFGAAPSAAPKESAEARVRQLSRLAAATPLAGTLASPDREATARAVEALLLDLGGRAARVPAGQRGPGVLLDLTVPESRDRELSAGLARLGSWRPEGSAPGPVSGFRHLRILVD
jgi:hypothetical protein